MASVYFSDEHETFRRSVRRFLEEEVAPHADDWEHAGRIPRSIYLRMGELGLLGILYPEAYGGAGADVFSAVVFLEELPRSRMGGFCAAVSVQQFMAVRHIAASGSEALKRRYLAPSIRGEKVGALAVSEPDCGSDVASLRTRAERRGGVYVVNGAKTFITNGAEGDFVTLAVRTGRQEDGAAGVSLLVVDSDAPGVRVSRRLQKLGWHASDTAELAFEDVEVPADRLVGEENSGFYQIMEAFALERLCAAAIAVGSAQIALDLTRAYMGERVAFGKPLSRFQTLTHRMADLAAELEAARQLTYHAAWLTERGDSAITEAAMAKLVTTELGKRVADECLQIYGGYGYMEEYPMARFYRDARAATIAAGTSEIMREIVARTLFEPTGGPDRATAAGEARHPPATTAGHSSPKPAASSGAPAAPPKTAGRAAPTSYDALLRSLPDRMRGEEAEGWDAVFHFVLTDADRPQWTLRVRGGRAEVVEGLDGEADCTVQMRRDTYEGIETGAVNPQAAYLMGKVKVSSLSEMMRFVKVFRRTGR